MASFVYNSCLRDTFRARLDFEGGAFRVLLLGDGYVPNKDEHTRRLDIVGEIDGQGYQPGGAAVDVRASMIDGRLTLSLGGNVFPNASISARYAVYYADRGEGPEHDELVALIDFGGMVISTNGDWSLGSSTLRIQN